MTPRPLPRALGALFAFLAFAARAQPVDIPNGRFDVGVHAPVDWTLSGKGDYLTQGPADPGRVVTVSGNGADTAAWRSKPLALSPRALYVLSFQARRIGEGSGSAISGPAFANRDVHEIGRDWAEIESVFATPDALRPEESHLRFGHWHARGTLAFADVALHRAAPLHARFGDLVLGEGESLRGAEYAFDAPFRSASRNSARPLAGFTCGFNTDRWTFSPDTHVTYRHELAWRKQSAARVDVSVTYYAGGQLVVEASADGKTWRELGTLSKVSSGSFPIPADLLPATDVYVRLRAAPLPAGRGANLQVGIYSYHATLAPTRATETPAAAQPLVGKTVFIKKLAAHPGIRLEIESIGDALPGGDNAITGTLRAADVVNANARVEVTWSGRHPEPGRVHPTMFQFKQNVRWPYELPGPGSGKLTVHLGDTAVAEIPLSVPNLHDTSYGRRVAASTDAVNLWWCSSGHKVSRTRPPPAHGAEDAGLTLRAAANESEAAQLVLRPAKPLKGLTARVTGFDPPAVASPPRSAVSRPQIAVDVLRVRYVPVAHPTDSVGCVAPWPDPLPPFASSIDLPANANQPLWVRVTVPKGTPAGTYRGTLRLAADGWSADVPLAVEVFNFSLPDRLACATAFGFSPSNVFRYQKLEKTEDRRAVLEKYWANFAAHHVSPYDPAPMDPIKVAWPGRKAKVEDLTVKFDFDRWDTAMARAMDVYHFNSFRLNLHGMGGGTFHQRVAPELLGFAENTPQYQALMASYLRGLEKHLADKGWLDRAFVYWFDEPDPKDYDFVNNGFAKLKKFAPRLPRMLTEQVEERLVGGPTIWCPISNEYKHDRAEPRRAAGEKFWWYVCTGPKAPYATLFIDHPATEMRAWLWQTWQRKIEGVLVWETNYWTSPTAYPDPARPQNPYEDPMGWQTGYGAAKGAKRPWGNGDGRFIYPPEAAADGRPAAPVLDGPVDSIRWEMLRDGLEDYEYLAILRQEISQLPPERRARYEPLLAVPETITRDMTTFTTDPGAIESRREQIARAIEEIRGR